MSQQDTITALTDANFEAQALRATQPVIVAITSPWNQGTSMMEPALLALAKEFSSRVTTFRVNVDEHPMVVAHYEATTLPTLLLVHDGMVHETLEGALPKPRIRQLYESATDLLEED